MNIVCILAENPLIYVYVLVNVNPKLSKHIALFQNNMRFVIAKVFRLLQYSVLFIFNCVVARQLYSGAMKKGKLLKNLDIYPIKR